MTATIRAIEYSLPENRISNEQLAHEFADWSMDQIEEKTGILERRIATEEQCASDLAVAAAAKLFATDCCRAADVDYLLFCTQTPDYFLPTTACLLQDRLGLPTRAGALDFNLGCSGFIYGLSLAKGLIETDQARTVILLTADTYSKLLNPSDRSVRTIFGDGAAATLIQRTERASPNDRPSIGPFIFGTDGKGGKNLIVKAGGMRNRAGKARETGNAARGEPSQDWDHLYMNGPEIFTFTLRTIPRAIQDLLSKANQRMEDVDLFVFHQANRYMLEHLRKKLNIPSDKFAIELSYCGNTVSSSIPIALKALGDKNKVRPGMQVMLVGFGVGYSWGATLIRLAAE